MARLQGIEALECAKKNPYAWPGGYDVYLIMTDGGLLCHDCVNEEYELIREDTEEPDGRHNSGWVAAGMGTTEGAEDMVMCDHCGKIIHEPED